MIGSSGTFPVAGRPASGYLIEQGGTRVWCDAGFGTFAGLPVDSDMVDAIVVSHQHPDHCADLAAAFHAWTYRPDPKQNVPLYAPQAVWDRLSLFLEKGADSDLSHTFDFQPVWTGSEIEIGSLRVAFTEMDHSVPTVGSRWEANNRTLFYTGDTGPSGSWGSLARGVDVLLSEASYQDSTRNAAYPHHLSATEIGQIARDLEVKRLVLTHIPPYLDPALSVHQAELRFDRPVRFATAGASFDV